MARLLPNAGNLQYVGRNMLPSFSISNFNNLPSTGIKNLTYDTRGYEDRRYKEPTNLGHLILGDFLLGSREVEDILHKHNLDTIADIPFVNRLVAAGLMSKRRFFDPFKEGRPWNAGINLAQTLGESLDILANPIKAAMPWAGGGSLGDVANALGLDGDYIRHYQWNVKTGSGVADLAVNLVGEILSDPLVVAGLVGKIPSKVVGETVSEVTEASLRRQITKVGAQVSDDVITHNTRKVTRAILKQADDLHYLKRKPNPKEFFEKLMNNVARDLGLDTTSLMSDLNTVTASQAYKSYESIAKVRGVIRRADRAVMAAAQWTTPIGPIKELYRIGSPIFKAKADHANALRDLVDPQKFLDDPVGALAVVETGLKEHTMKLHSTRINSWIRYFKMQGVDISYDELYALYKQVLQNTKASDRILSEVAIAFRNKLAQLIKQLNPSEEVIQNLNVFIENELPTFLETVQDSAVLMVQLEDNTANLIFNTIKEGVDELASTKSTVTGRSLLIEHLDYIDQHLLSSPAIRPPGDKIYNLGTYLDFLADWKEVQLTDVTDLSYKAQQARVHIQRALREYGITQKNARQIHKALRAGDYAAVEKIVKSSQASVVFGEQFVNKATTEVASDMRTLFKRVKESSAILKDTDKFMEAQEIFETYKGKFIRIRDSYSALLRENPIDIDDSVIHSLMDEATVKSGVASSYKELMSLSKVDSAADIYNHLTELDRVFYFAENLNVPGIRDYRQAIKTLLYDKNVRTLIQNEMIIEDMYYAIMSRTGKMATISMAITENMQNTALYQMIVTDTHNEAVNTWVMALKKAGRRDLADALSDVVLRLKNNNALMALYDLDPSELLRGFDVDKNTIEFLKHIAADVVLTKAGTPISKGAVEEIVDTIMRQIHFNHRSLIRLDEGLTREIREHFEEAIYNYMYALEHNANAISTTTKSVIGMNAVHGDLIRNINNLQAEYVASMEILSKADIVNERFLNDFEIFMQETGRPLDKSLSYKDYDLLVRQGMLDAETLLEGMPGKVTAAEIIESGMRAANEHRDITLMQVLRDTWNDINIIEDSIEGIYTKASLTQKLQDTVRASNIYDFSVSNGLISFKKLEMADRGMMKHVSFGENSMLEIRVNEFLSDVLKPTGRATIGIKNNAHIPLEYLRELLITEYSRGIGEITIDNPTQFFGNLSPEELLAWHQLSMKRNTINITLSSQYNRSYQKLLDGFREGGGVPNRTLETLERRAGLTMDEIKGITESDRIQETFDEIESKRGFATDEQFKTANESYSNIYEKAKLDELRTEDLQVRTKSLDNMTVFNHEFTEFIRNNVLTLERNNKIINDVHRDAYYGVFDKAIPEYNIRVGDSKNITINKRLSQLAKGEVEADYLENMYRFAREGAEDGTLYNLRNEIDKIEGWQLVVKDAVEDIHPYEELDAKLLSDAGLAVKTDGKFVLIHRITDKNPASKMRPVKKIAAKNNGIEMSVTLAHSDTRLTDVQLPGASNTLREGWYGGFDEAHWSYSHKDFKNYKVHLTNVLDLSAPETFPDGFVFPKLSDTMDVAVRNEIIMTRLERAAKEAGHPTVREWLMSLGYDGIYGVHVEELDPVRMLTGTAMTEKPQMVVYDLTKVFDESGKPLEEGLLEPILETQYTRRVSELDYVKDAQKVLAEEQVHPYIKLPEGIPFEMYNGEYIDPELYEDLFQQRWFREMLGEDNIQIVYELRRKGILTPNFNIVGKAGAYNDVTDVVKYGREAAGIFGDAVSSYGKLEGTDLKNYKYMSGYLDRALDELTSTSIRNASSETKYLQIMFNDDFALDTLIKAGMFKGKTDKDIAQFFKRGNWTGVILRKDGFGRPTVYRYNIFDKSTLAKAHKAKAVVVPEQIYRNMVLSVNNHQTTSKLLNMWERTIVSTYKTLWLFTAGFPIRNFADSNIIRNANELDGIFNAIKYDYQAMKALSEYDRIVAEILESTGGKTYNVNEIRKVLANYDYATQQRFKLVDLFIHSQASGGLTKSLDEYLKQFGSTEDFVGFAWERWYHEHVLYSDYVPTKLMKDINNWVEQNARLGMFFGLVDQGLDSSQAVAKIVATHFDYTLRSSGQNVIENLFWFSTFPLNNFAYWINEGMFTNTTLFKSILDTWELSWNNDQVSYDDLKKSRYLSSFALNGGLLVNVLGQDRFIKLGFSVFDFFQMITDPWGFVQEKLNPIMGAPLGTASPESLIPWASQYRNIQSFKAGKSLIPSVYTNYDKFNYRNRYGRDYDFSRWNYPRSRRYRARRPRTTGYRRLRRFYRPRYQRYRQGLTFKALNQQYAYQTYSPNSTAWFTSFRDTRRTNAQHRVTPSAKRVFKAR